MLWCRVGSYAFATHPALEGSKCSADGQCYQGDCVTKRSPKFAAFRKEALDGIKDLLQVSPAAHSNISFPGRKTTSSLQGSSNLSWPIMARSARLEKKKPAQNKAQAAQLARNTNPKKQSSTKKRFKASAIAKTGLLVNQSTATNVTASVELRNEKNKVNSTLVGNASLLNQSDFRASNKSTISTINQSHLMIGNASVTIQPFSPTELKKKSQRKEITSSTSVHQPKMMSELKRFFRSLTGSTRIFEMFKFPLG